MLGTISKPSVSPEEMEAILTLPYYRYSKLVLAPEEIVRRELGARRCERAFSCSPYYTQRAASDPDWWRKVYSSRVNW